jgi:hypothetical protein
VDESQSQIHPAGLDREHDGSREMKGNEMKTIGAGGGPGATGKNRRSPTGMRSILVRNNKKNLSMECFGKASSHKEQWK